jgi:hypothetical protein
MRVIVFGMVLLNSGALHAGTPRIGFLAAASSRDALGPHNRAAWQTAANLGQVTLLLRQGDGSFADASGNAREMSDFDVVWYHQGDAIERGPMYQGRSLTEIRRYAQGGGAVLLSGGALALVAPLGLETQIRPQRHELGNWRDPAGMVPVEKTHPVFRGLSGDGEIVWLSRGGCRAVADFYWGGPAEGMILARTPSGPENPLVEYVLGQGRVIVFGWHWPDYADVESPHRANLVRLTSNLLGYLADQRAWRPLVLRSAYPPVAAPDRAGISPQRWRALQMAIEDLSADFPDRYRDGAVYLKRLRTLRAEYDRMAPVSDANALGAMATRFETLKDQALLANPLLDFDTLLMIRR